MPRDDLSGKTSRVTAIVSWFDETPEMLSACISSLAGVVDHVIAVDGAYFLYPEGRASSDPAQARIIAEICRGMRIGYTIHIPGSVWAGNEVQKRNHAIRLAELVTREDGWYFVHDADCVVTEIAPNWFEVLESDELKEFAAINIACKEVRDIPGYDVPPTDGFSPIRLVYRALPGATYGPTHWCISAKESDEENAPRVYLWGDSAQEPVEAYDGTYLLKIEHRKDRPNYRDVSARQYYVRRERFGIESHR